MDDLKISIRTGIRGVGVISLLAAVLLHIELATMPRSESIRSQLTVQHLAGWEFLLIVLGVVFLTVALVLDRVKTRRY